VLERGAAGWPAAGSLNLLSRREGAEKTLLQLYMLEVWYQDDLVNIKAMSMASYCFMSTTSLQANKLCRSRHIAAGLQNVDRGQRP
jgi:hypothetical protein